MVKINRDFLDPALGAINDHTAALLEKAKAQQNAVNAAAQAVADKAKSDLIFTCVPIGAISEIVEKITPYLNKNQVIVDVASVKTYPKEIYSKILDKTQVLLTHPLF